MNDTGLIGKLAIVGIVIVALVALGSGGGWLFALGKTVLIVFAVIGILIVVLIGLVLWLALRSSRSGKPTMEKTEKAALEEAKHTLLSLRLMLKRIENSEMQERGESVCVAVSALLKSLSEKPEAIPRARRYLSYYLPTLEKILSRYREMEQNRVLADGMTEHVLSCLADIRQATEKQHRNLYEADILDLSVEMEVMTMMCKRDGLLSDDEEDGVTLTL